MRKILAALTVTMTLFATGAKANGAWGYEWVSGGCWGATWFTTTTKLINGNQGPAGYLRYERNDVVWMCAPI